jgi:hypothetical protein
VLHASLLLSSGERPLKLTIDEEIAQNATWAPGGPIGPAFDARGLLFIYEDVSALDQSTPLTIAGPPGKMVEGAAETSLEEQKTIMC